MLKIFRILMLSFVLCLALNAPQISCQAQTAEFQPSYRVNRVKSCVHLFFSHFEQDPRNAEVIVGLLADDKILIEYPWAKFNAKDEYKEWILAIPGSFHDAHHINEIQVEIVNDAVSRAFVDVFWQNQGPKGEYASDHLNYVFEFAETGGILPKITKIFCKKVE